MKTARMHILHLTGTMAAASLAISAPRAQAQDIGGVFDMGTMTATAAMDPVIEQSRRMSIRKGQGDPLPGRGTRSLTRGLAQGFTANAGAPSAGALRASAATLSYRPSAAVRKANFARFVERSRAKDPASAAKLAEVFRTTDVMASASGWMKPYGLSHTNVADAAAVYLTIAWLTVHGRTNDPGQAEVRAVRNQFAASAGSAPGFRGASDAIKQELSEAMIVQAMLIAQYANMAESKPDLMKKVQSAVAAGAKNTFGFDLRSMNLSANGLR